MRTPSGSNEAAQDWSLICRNIQGTGLLLELERQLQHWPSTDELNTELTVRRFHMLNSTRKDSDQIFSNSGSKQCYTYFWSTLWCSQNYEYLAKFGYKLNIQFSNLFKSILLEPFFDYLLEPCVEITWYFFPSIFVEFWLLKISKALDFSIFNI
jgi:hypothetical protein